MANPIELVIQGRDNTGSAFASAGGALSKIGNIAAGILASQVFTKLAQGAMEFGQSVFTEAMDAQLGLAQLDAVLKSTAGASGMTKEAIIGLADSLSGVTRYSDDAILAGENMLLTFTNIGADVFPGATQAILDMSTALGQDMQSSAIQLGKALNDPVAGVTALQRVGVKLTEEQKKQVESFMKVNDIASAQKVILGELATEFGGSAAAAGKTFAGQMDILKNKVNNLKEGLGLKLMPTIQTFADKLIAFADNPAVIKFFDDLANGIIKIMEQAGNLPAMFEGAKKGVMDFVTPFIPAIESIRSTMDAMRPTIEAVAISLGGRLVAAGKVLSDKVFPFLVSTLDKFAAWFAANRPLIEAFITTSAERFAWLADAVVGFWDVIEPLLTGFMDLIMEYVELVMEISTGDWTAAWETMGEIVNTIWTAIKASVLAALNWIANLMGTSLAKIKAQWSSNWNQLKQIVTTILTLIKNTIVSKFNEIKTAISSAMIAITTTIRTKWEEIKTTFNNALTALYNAVVTKFNQIRTAISSTFTAIVSAVRAKWEEIKAAFTNALAAIITAIITWGANLRTKIGEAIQGALDWIKEKIGDFVDIGATIITNIIQGLEDNFQALIDWLTDLITNLITGVFGGGGAGLLGGLSLPLTLNPTMGGGYASGAAGGFTGGGVSPLTTNKATSNYYNAHITVYTGKIDPKKSMRGFI